MLTPDHDREQRVRRTTIHFPGFEPLSAAQHRQRFQRSAAKTAKLWGIDIGIGEPQEAGRAYRFTARAKGADWQVHTTVHMLDHNRIVEQLNGQPLFRRIVKGFRCAGSVIREGAAAGYFKHAWRFGLFFVFPFLCMSLACLATLIVLVLPLLFGPLWLVLFSAPLAWLFFFKIVLAWFRRFHVLHLFADWELAVAVARLDRAYLDEWLEDSIAAVTAALQEEADEYLISSHSMGSALATQVLGAVLERHPTILQGKKIAFVTLGGAVLQAALLRSAVALRQRAGLILRDEAVTWLEVQCLTDVVSFYKTAVATLTGHPDAPAPRIFFIRLKPMLARDRYLRIKYDFLRIHRQYVLDADHRTEFDFVYMVVGPKPAAMLGLALENAKVASDD